MTHVKLDKSTLGADLRAASDSGRAAAMEALVALQQKKCAGADATGWYDWPKREGFKLVGQCKRWLQGFPLPYDLVLVAGIGGSFAGARAIDEALRHSYQSLLADQGLLTGGSVPMVYAGHNLSEAQLIELLDLLPTRQVVLNVISKSGTTTETSVAFRILRQYMEQRYGKEEASQRIVVTTDPEQGVLRQLAKVNGYTAFAIPPDVGGRYSLLTAVGMVPLIMAGHDGEALMEGAAALFASLEDEASLPHHPVIELAAIRRAAWDAGLRLDVLGYGDPKLGAFVEWWKQLFGESEGKDDKGLFPAGMAYTTDLHSLGQYLQEGPVTMLETFLFCDEEQSYDAHRVERRLKVPRGEGVADGLTYLEGRYIGDINRAAMNAARWAHSDRGVPCIALHAPRLDTYTLGYLVAMFEVVCAVSGALLAVNPFDQPGVEAYKKNLFALMGKAGYEALTERLRQRQP